MKRKITGLLEGSGRWVPLPSTAMVSKEKQKKRARGTKFNPFDQKNEKKEGGGAGEAI